MQASDEPKVTVDHLRRLGLCAKGSRDTVVKLYGKLGWSRLIRHGVPVSELEDATHPDVQAAVALAKKEYYGG